MGFLTFFLTIFLIPIIAIGGEENKGEHILTNNRDDNTLEQEEKKVEDIKDINLKDNSVKTLKKLKYDHYQKGFYRKHDKIIKVGKLLPFVSSKYNSLIIKSGQLFSDIPIHKSKMDHDFKEKHPFDIHAKHNIGCKKCHVDQPYKKDYKSIYLNKISTIIDKDGIDRFAGIKSKKMEKFKVKSCIDTDCHTDKEVQAFHSWLPATKKHLKKISCETCHIPKRYLLTASLFNYTFVDNNKEPLIKYKGGIPNGKMIGFKPDWIWYKHSDGEMKITPVNMVSFLVWVDNSKGDKSYIYPKDIYRFLYKNGNLDRKVLSIFDKNGDKKIDIDESLPDNKDKKEIIIKILKKNGIKDPIIKLISIPIALQHNIVEDENMKNCENCHSKSSKIVSNIELTNFKIDKNDISIITPNSNRYNFASIKGDKVVLDKKKLPKSYFLMGVDTKTPFIDKIILILLILTLVSIAGHGFLRVIFYRKRS